MPKPSAFMVRLQENQRHNMHLQRLFTIQQCEDMALITLNEDFGFGESRAREFLARFRETFKAYAELCIEDAKDDKDLAVTKASIETIWAQMPFIVPFNGLKCVLDAVCIVPLYHRLTTMITASAVALAQGDENQLNERENI